MTTKGLLWSAAFLIAMLRASAYGWTALPDGTDFPVQWNINGDANRYASKVQTLIFLPALTAVLALLFAITPKIFPRRENLEKSRAFYMVGWLGGLGIIAIVHIGIIYTAITGKPPLIQLTLIANGLFLVLLGNYMTKSRSNWVVGIRNPWTLSSEHSWIATNRFAGQGFVIIGMATIISALVLTPSITLKLVLAGLAATVFVSFGISYVAWRRDPERK